MADGDDTEGRMPRGVRQAVCYDDILEPPTQDPLEAQREAARKRAERFGTEYKEPKKHLVLNRTELAASKSKREGFVTGIDLFSEEERLKREKRAAKFGNTLLGLTEEEQEKAEKLKKRMERFGPVETTPPEDVAGSMDIDPLEARKEAAKDAEPRMDAVYLYGVDVMSTKDCLDYFDEYGPKFAEWIDDSSCVVVFGDEFTARRIIMGMGTALPIETQMPDCVAPELAQLFKWHKGPDFNKGGTPIALQFRIATTADVKTRKGKPNSRYLWKQQGGGQGGRGGGGRNRQGAQGGREASQRGERPAQSLTDLIALGAGKGKREREKPKRKPADAEGAPNKDIDLRSKLKNKSAHDPREQMFSYEDEVIFFDEDEGDAMQVEEAPSGKRAKTETEKTADAVVDAVVETAVASADAAAVPAAADA